MCHAALAYSFGPTINERLSPADARDARDAVDTAKKLCHGSMHSYACAFTTAIDSRIPPCSAHNETTSVHGSCDTSYIQATESFRRAFPKDATAHAMHAEAMLQRTPWRYVSLSELTPEARAAHDVLNLALSIDSSHPLALHLLVHVREQLPHGGGEAALDAAKRLSGVEFDDAAHLTHMAGHVYLRAGLYADAIRVNLRAQDSDTALKQNCLDPYGPGHNIASRQFAATLVGEKERALADTASVTEMGAAASMTQAIHPYPRLVLLLRFRDWAGVHDELKRVNAPEDEPVGRVIWNYAAALLAARRGKITEARRLLALLEEAAKKIPEDGQDALPDTAYANMFLRGSPFFGEWRRIAGIARDTVEARLLVESSEPWSAVQRVLSRAADAQGSFSYMEPELWVPSLRVCLAEAHRLAGDIATAERLYHDEFHHRPNSREEQNNKRGVNCPEVFG